MNKPTAIAFGAILWDVLPDGKLPGGVPMNVANHLQKVGVEAGRISEEGKGESGGDLKNFLSKKDISTDLLQTDTFVVTQKGVTPQYSPTDLQTKFLQV